MALDLKMEGGSLSKEMRFPAEAKQHLKGTQTLYPNFAATGPHTPDNGDTRMPPCFVAVQNFSELVLYLPFPPTLWLRSLCSFEKNHN